MLVGMEQFTRPWLAGRVVLAKDGATRRVHVFGQVVEVQADGMQR